MQTVVLAAGQGTRMRPLTDRRPKPMVPVADRPLVGHTLADAAASGADRFVVVVGYERSSIEDAFGTEHAGVPIEYVEQRHQRGTADAVRAAVDALEDDPFVVVNGDALYDRAGLTALYDGGPAVGSVRAADPTQYGVLDVADGLATGVVEKPSDPPSDLVNAGAYVFPAAAREWLDVAESERGEYELTDVVARTIDRTDVRAVAFDRWLDVGRPWELLAANEWKVEELASERERVDGAVSDDATLRGPVAVESGATIREGVTIEGPALVRAGATVGPTAYIRGTTLVGPDAEVGHAVEVKNSVLMAGASVSHLSYVGDSIVGRDVNLGAGTTVANLRHDDRPVELTVKGERVSTGRRKFGVVVGDGAKTGINVSLNAGVTVGTDALVGPGETVVRDVE